MLPSPASCLLSVPVCDAQEFLEDGAHAFAGGRYGMARELVSRNLSFLEPYALGEICHIVQLAIQQRTWGP